MKKTISFSALLGIISFAVSCNKQHAAAGTGAMKKKQPAQVAAAPPEGAYCFLKAENQDTTLVRLTVTGNRVSGEMTWQPWQKDGAAGTLTGKLLSDREMELVYDYTIEDSRQSETKIMKIENDTLYLKTGELTDPGGNGHLVYKDASKAVYSVALIPVSCK